MGKTVLFKQNNLPDMQARSLSNIRARLRTGVSRFTLPSGVVLSVSILTLFTTLVMADAVMAADKHFIGVGASAWNQYPNGGFESTVSGPPSINDRGIYDRAGTGASYISGGERRAGQLVFLSPYTGSGFTKTPFPRSSIFTLYGIDGLGIDNQVDQQITLNDKLQLAGDQEWRISSENGSITQIVDARFTDSSFDLNNYMLTLNGVNKGNSFILNQTVSGTGGIIITGEGTVFLTEDNSYSGGTFLNSGTLSLDKDGALGTGILTVNGGVFQVTGDSYNSLTNDLVWGSAGGTFDIVEANNNFTVAQILDNGSLTKTGAGALTLASANLYTGTTVIEAGTLALAGEGSIAASAGVENEGVFDISATVTGALIKSLSGSGVVNLGSQSLELTAANDIFSGSFTGTGGLILSGGFETLTGDNSGFTGQTSVLGGTLAVNNSLGGTMHVAGGRLQGVGTVGTTTHEADGIIAPGNSIGKLTIDGNYIGNGGVIEIEANLDDDSSSADHLYITGNTSGTGKVKVLKLSEAGAQTSDGIRIIEIDGDSEAEFSLLGDYEFQGDQAIIGGAYAYRLYQHSPTNPDDGNWYLRSALKDQGNGGDPAGDLYNPAAPVYEAYAGVLLNMNEVATLQQRIGNRYSNERATVQSAEGNKNISAFWGRVEGSTSKFQPKTSTSAADYTIDQWKIQAGIDGQFYESSEGVLIGGLTAHYNCASAKISSFFGDGKIDVDGYGLGGSMTWYDQSGIYLDGQLQATWYNSNLHSNDAKQNLVHGNDAFGYVVSIEAGQRFALTDGWSLTPQAQLYYSAVDFDSFRTEFSAGSADISLEKARSLKGRMAMAADYRNVWTGADGKSVNSNVYGIVNLYQEFMSGTVVDVSGTDFASQIDRTWGGLGIGGKYSWADNKFSVYGEAGLNTSLNNFADNYRMNASLGLKVAF